MSYIGDFPEDHTTVSILFTTHAATGAAVAPSSGFEAADVLIYKNGSGAQKATTNGITMTSPFDSVTGLHCLVIDTSVDTGDVGFWTTGAHYTAVLSPDETVDSLAVVKVIATFSLALAPVFARVGAPAGASVSADVAAVKAVLPAALISGRIDASVGAMANDVVTNAAIAADAIGSNELAASAASEIGTAVWAVATRELTAGTNIVLAKGTGVTGFNDLSAAQVNAEADTALSDAGVTSVRQAHLDADITSRMATFNYTAPLDAAGTRSALGLASANLDSQIATLATAAALSSLSSGISASFTSLASYGDLHWSTATGFATVNPDNAGIAAIQERTDSLPDDPADASDIATAFTALASHGDGAWGTATGFATPADVSDGTTTVTDAISGITVPSAADNAAAVLAATYEGAETVQDHFRLARAALYGKANGLEGTTVHFRDLADAKNRITSTVTADGNRTSITTDAT
ncbi:MAG: hypothetical protein EOR12_27015 [Mesorhizobium sp.]|uniref:hypothetical protein n=1 Tax=Mesorhizobium sp. TaxID=1871066 RepID=UPI000FE4600D|nr:hypothetical protein [Mesorhizobium sp.]RWP84886.1 MAG: hypothetical protein EOR12_27015 [Mesorhizobium sp.]